MMVHIPKVLAPEQVARCRDVMVKAAWVDGRVTAGHQSEKVKNNLQEIRKKGARFPKRPRGLVFRPRASAPRCRCPLI